MSDDKVQVKYSGPDGLVFDSIAVYNDGEGRVQQGQSYSVPESVAAELEVYEGWSRGGEDSVVEQVESQKGEAGPLDVDPRGNSEAMAAYNEELARLGAEADGEDSGDEDEDAGDDSEDE